MTGHRIRRCVGNSAIVVALVGFGLAAGLAIGAPAHANGSDSIQIRMAGQAEFSRTTTQPLLAIAALAPGRSVGGSMDVRDTSDTHPGSDVSDALLLTMINVDTESSCRIARACPGPGAALAASLQFSLRVTDSTSDATLRQSVETSNSLRGGVVLASGLSSGDEVTVHLAASLPEATGNAVQDATIDFDLQVGLISVADHEHHSGTSGSEPPTNATSPPDETVTLGDGGSLSYTGIPLRALASTACALLVVGVSLLTGVRRRNRQF